MADKSLLAELLLSPSDVRKKEEQERLARGQMQAQMIGQGMGGVGGMFAAFGAQQAAQTENDIAKAFRRAGTGLGVDMRSPEERQAAQFQELMKGTNTQNLTSLKTRRKLFVEAGAPAKALEAIDRQIATLEAGKKAEISAQNAAAAEKKQQDFLNNLETRRVKVQEKDAETRRLTQAVNSNKSKAEIAEIEARIEKLDKELDILDATSGFTVRSAEAKARSDEAAADVAEGTIQYQVDEAKFNSALQQLALEKGRELLPYEIERERLNNEHVSETTKSEIAERLREDAKSEIPVDEFTRMLELSGFSDERKDELIQQRAIAMASGGDQAFDPNEAANKARVEGLTSYLKEYQTTKNRLGMYSAMMDAGVLANIGPRSSIEDIGTNIASFLGFDEGSAASNALIDMFLKGEVLGNVSLLTGAISEKELQFLIDMVPGRNQPPELFYTNFGKKRAEAEAQLSVMGIVEQQMMQGDTSISMTFRDDLEDIYTAINYGMMASKFNPMNPAGKKPGTVQYDAFTRIMEDAKRAKARLGDRLPEAAKNEFAAFLTKLTGG